MATGAFDARAESARGDFADRRVDLASANSARLRAPARGPRPSGQRAGGAPVSSWPRIVCAGKSAGARAAVAAAFLHRPFQRGFDRRRRGVDVMAVKAKPGLQPQAVARAKPDRHTSLVGQQQLAPAARPDRPARKSQNRPRRYSPSATQNSHAGDLARAGVHELHLTDVGAKLASTEAAFGPCSAINARSASGSITQTSESCRAACASSASLQAALTTRNRARRNSRPSDRRGCRRLHW